MIPNGATDDDIIAIVRCWVDVLASGDPERVGAELGYGLAFGEPNGACIRRTIQDYRSPSLYPGVEHFAVTDWRVAEGGNPAPRGAVTRYLPNAAGLAGAVEFDLPLNGRWSDLCAVFVWFVGDVSGGHSRLGLEEISSWQPNERDAGAAD